MSRSHVCTIVTAILALAGVGPWACAQTVHVHATAETLDEGAATTIVRVPWGTACGQLGKVDEASRPGPMDFAVVGDTLYVLDSVNARVQLFGLDGGFRREIPIGTKTADFLTVSSAGDVTVLDAFVRRELRTFSADGELVAHAALPLTMGLCSGIFACDGRLWLEERHARAHCVSWPPGKGRAAARITGSLPGRPLGPDELPVRAQKKAGRDVILRFGALQRAGRQITLRFARPLASILALESDDMGRTYVAAACPKQPDGDEWKTDIVLAVIEPDTQQVAAIRMPNAYITDHYRKLLVTRAGDVIQMQTAEDGVRFVRWTLPDAQVTEDAR